MFSQIYNASNLEELRKAYRFFVKHYHPDNFYHTGDSNLIEMYTAYMKQAHTLFDEKTKELEAKIVELTTPTTTRKHKGIYYRENIKVSEVCSTLKEFLKSISSRFCSFNCYSKANTLFVYASKGSMLLEGFQIVSENFIDYIDSEYPEYFKSTALIILHKINQYRLINSDRTSNFKVILSIGKSTEQPYRRIKATTYVPHDTSYWLEQVKSGKVTFVSIPKRYRTEGFVTMCVGSLETLAEEIIDFFPELLTKDSISIIRKNFPYLRGKLPKTKKAEKPLDSKVLQLVVQAFQTYSSSKEDGVQLLKATEECLGLIQVSSGQVAHSIKTKIEPSVENLNLLSEMEFKAFSCFLYKPLQSLLLRKAKMPEDDCIWNPVEKRWEEK